VIGTENPANAPVARLADGIARSARHADEPKQRALAPHASRFLEAGQMVRDELPADSEGPRDRGGLRSLEPTKGCEDPKADVPELPMSRVETMHFRLAARHVISGSTVRVFLEHEAVAEERVQVVARRAHREIQGTRDGAEMVSGKSTEVIVDPTANRMI
jgi:hypothetical protein